jgi:hypothetical protein
MTEKKSYQKITAEKRKAEMQIIKKNIADLIPYANNSRKHSDKQIKQVASSIKEFGFLNPVIIDKDNGIIAGHCRVMACEKLGIKEVPCISAEHLTEAQKKAYIIADNQLALGSEWDMELLKVELEGLKELDFDVDLLGFDGDFFKLDELEASEVEQESQYTRKISIPIYEITGEKPTINEMIDTKKADDFIKEIKAKKFPKEIEEFLIKSATRLYEFNYSKIAEYYAHQDNNIQETMEDLALVLIDFDKAIEKGYVELNKFIEEIFLNDRVIADDYEE